MIHALRYTEELEKVGFSTEQAKKSVQVWMELMDQNFATKADFKEHYFMIKTDMMKLGLEFKERCDDIEKILDQRCDDVEKKLNQRCDAIDKRCDAIDKRCDDIEKKLDKRCDGIDKRCDAIETKIDKLESTLVIKLGIMMATSIGIVSTIISFNR